MARFIFPLFLIALGIFGLAERDAINRQWADMYPPDAARQNALTRCAQDDSLFNRFSASGRAACYQKYLQVELAPAAPGIIVGVPGAAPGHVVPHAPPVRTNTNNR
jgi:hypothetical protein